MQRINLAGGFYALVDEQDVEKLGARKWHRLMVRNGPYASRMRRYKGKWKRELMHRLILNAPEHLQVDHINRNGLDNRRINLRLCTRSQNLGNSQSRHAYREGKFKGVHPYGKTNKWLVQIGQKRIGVFADPIEAAKAYDVAAIKKWGSFARTNAMLQRF